MRLFLLAGLVMLLQNANAQSKKTIESKIEKVTVFLEGAQTERTAKTSLAAGKQELIFANISPSIDKQSIQVKADGNVTILSVIHQQNFMKEQQKQDEIKEAEALKEAQTEKIALQKNILNVYKQEETLLLKNQQIGGANTGLKAADLKDAADLQRARLTEVYQKQMETDRAIKKMEAELAKMNKQLQELNQKADISTSEIHVTLSTKEAGSSQFSISYMVKKAGWYPTYDIRVKDISSPINMQYKANVFQQSGEDWKDIRLFLSTGNPNENANKPSLEPWYLKYVYAYRQTTNTIQATYTPGTVSGKVVDERGNPVAGASVVLKGTRSGTTTNAGGIFQINVPAGANSIVISSVGMQTTEVPASVNGLANITLQQNLQSLEEVVVTAYGIASDRETYTDIERSENNRNKQRKSETALTTTISYQPTTTVYEIKEPYTILNDGKTYMAEIDGYELNAGYEYYTAPKMSESAYLTAKITNWQELNLLPGEANLFFEGTFLGKSLLDVAKAGDTLSLSLGKDKGVVVKRTLMKEYSSKRFIGSNRTDTRQYEITIRNNKQLPINIIVEDQFPISTQKEIEVQDRKYEGAKLDEDTQQITWQQTVDAKKETKLSFRYEVKYPKDKTLQLD